jgi:transcriptional regulator with XRE-family HTH domain
MSRARQLAANLSLNLRRFRELKACSQARLSELTGIPRPTLSALESGSANPTLSLLVQLADGLQVRLEELLEPPRDIGRLYKAAEFSIRNNRGVELRAMLPDSIPGITLERMAFPPYGRITGIPHTPGSREYLFCESGSVILTTESQKWVLDAGDVVVYRGDQSHGYYNPQAIPAVAFTLIALGRLEGQPEPR